MSYRSLKWELNPTLQTFGHFPKVSPFLCTCYLLGKLYFLFRGGFKLNPIFLEDSNKPYKIYESFNSNHKPSTQDVVNK